MNRPSARTTSAPQRLSFAPHIYATHSSLPSLCLLLALSFVSTIFLSFSLCVFSRFSIVLGINAPYDRPRYAEKNTSSFRSARLADTSSRTYRYLPVDGTPRGSATRPAQRASRRPFARSIFTRSPDAGNYITPEPAYTRRARDDAFSLTNKHGVACGVRPSTGVGTRDKFTHISTCAFHTSRFLFLFLTMRSYE